jgi:hypothetical protein
MAAGAGACRIGAVMSCGVTPRGEAQRRSSGWSSGGGGLAFRQRQGFHRSRTTPEHTRLITGLYNLRRLKALLDFRTGLRLNYIVKVLGKRLGVVNRNVGGRYSNLLNPRAGNASRNRLGFNFVNSRKSRVRISRGNTRIIAITTNNCHKRLVLIL